MWFHCLLIKVSILSIITFAQEINLLRECAKYYRPKNYLDALPNLPYINQLTMPNSLSKVRNKGYIEQMHNIVPSPVITTKVVTVKTKYVYPVCVKYTKKQKLCSPGKRKVTNNINKLITKQHFIKKKPVEKKVESKVEVTDENHLDIEKFNLKVSFDPIEPSESYEDARAFRSPTPSVSPEKVQELLIEDRLDQLETILPDYKRRRTFETSTIFVTKTISNRKAMATLVVKNCVPMGYDVCTKKKGRSSKVARRTYESEEEDFFFG